MHKTYPCIPTKNIYAASWDILQGKQNLCLRVVAVNSCPCALHICICDTSRKTLSLVNLQGAVGCLLAESASMHAIWQRSTFSNDLNNIRSNQMVLTPGDGAFAAFAASTDLGTLDSANGVSLVRASPSFEVASRTLESMSLRTPVRSELRGYTRRVVAAWVEFFQVISPLKISLRFWAESCDVHRHFVEGNMVRFNVTRLNCNDLYLQHAVRNSFACMVFRDRPRASQLNNMCQSLALQEVCMCFR